MTVGAIVAQLRIDMTNFREGLGKANSLLEQYSGSALRASGILTGFGAAVAGGIALATKASAEFEAEMRNVNSILKESEPSFRSLSEAVLALSGKVGQAPEVLARGLYDIASSGFSGAEGLKVLEASAIAATAGLTDTATASKAITAVINAYGMTADDAGMVSDVLFKTVERGVITFGELASNIGQVISTAAQAKVPLEEVGAAIATMTRAGVQAPEAVTSLNQMLLSFIRPTDQAKSAASRLGIELTATNLAAKGLSGVVQEMATALKLGADDLDAMQKAGASDAEIMALIAQRSGVATAAMAELFPNVRALRGALALASQGGREFSEDVQAMARATGASASAFAEQSKSFQVQWAKSWAAMRAFAVQVGAAFLPVLKGLAEALKTIVQLADVVPAPLRTTLAVVILLVGGFASLTGAFILYNAYLKEAVVLSGGLVGAMRQMTGSLAAANVEINLTSVSLAKLAAGAKTAGAAVLSSLRGGALGFAAITIGLSVLVRQFTEAERMGKEFADTLGDLDKRAFAVKVRMQDLEQPSFWSRMMEWAGYRTQDMDQFLSQMGQYRQKVEAAEQAQQSQEARTAKLKEIEQELARFRGEAHAARMQEIGEEAKALERDLAEAGMEAEEARAQAARWAAAARSAAEREATKDITEAEIKLLELQGRNHEARMRQIEAETQAVREKYLAAGQGERAEEVARQYRTAAIAAYERERRDIILQAEQKLVEALVGHEEQVAGARERLHRVRLQQIESEAEAIKSQLIAAGDEANRAELARRQYLAAKTAELARAEAEERARIFEQSADAIVSTWVSAVEGMRQADRLQANEYLSQLSRVLDLIRQVNAARAQAGQSRLFQQEELRLAQTIFSERQRMQRELTASEKQLADARRDWAQEELDQRARLHTYEMSLIDLTFQHKRDLAQAAGEDNEETLSRIAAEELAALQRRRAEEQLSAQERFDSLERERQLILEMAQAGEMPEAAASDALQSTFEEMKRAKEELAAQDRAAFEERQRQHQETLKQIETEQKTLRTQLAETGGRVLQVADQVFAGLEQRLRSLGSVKLQPVPVAVAGAAAGAPRAFNFYLNGRQVGAGGDINRIADQLAEMLEREHTYARD